MPTASRSPLIIAGALLTVTLLAAPAGGRSGVDWEATTPLAGRVVDGELMVEGPGHHHLLTIADPGVTGDRYAVTGSVRHEDVGGPAYLEMWSHFADGGAYFSRTLAEAGPMAALAGSADARPFELPFFLDGAPGPERIELNLVLPEGGTVWIGPLELVGFGGGATSAWWSEERAGVVGAVGGVLVGLAGATIGILGRGPGRRRAVEGALLAGAGLGTVLLVVAVAALVADQPRHVWSLPGLIGLVLIAVDVGLLPTARRSTREAELRRIRALDA